MFQDEAIPQIPASRNKTRSASEADKDRDRNMTPTPRINIMPALNEDESLRPQIPWRQPMMNMHKSHSRLDVMHEPNTITPSFGPSSFPWNNGHHQRRESASTQTLQTILTSRGNTMRGTHTMNTPMANMGNTMKNVNGYNYNEYIMYQKEQINELKNKIDELNQFEIKYQELQLILDTKNKEINYQNEEIIQLNQDKREYMIEIERIKSEYDILLKQNQELHQIKKVNEIQAESNQILAQEMERYESMYQCVI